MPDNIIKLWMPISKDIEGNYVGILSDTSIDRDEEMMGKELLQEWAKNKSLPALSQHENKMKSWVGGWNKLKVISKGKHNALTAKPWFFSKEANPEADMIRKQIDEAVENGLNPGISIGAIPLEDKIEEIEGKEYKVYIKAELLEASWVPLQSNRNASYGHIAKSFDLNLIKNSLEEKKMEKDIEKDIEKTYSKKEFDEQVSKLKKEVEEAEAKAEEAEAKVEEAEAKVEEAEAEAETKAEEAEKAEKSLKELKLKAVNLPRKETEAEVKGVKELTVEKMLGGQEDGKCII